VGHATVKPLGRIGSRRLLISIGVARSLAVMKPCTFARMVQGYDMLDRDALQRVGEAQARNNKPLGDIVRDFGMLTVEQVESLRQKIRQQLAEDVQWLPEAMRESELGRLSCYRGLLTEDELKAALWSQALLAAEGVEELLGALLVRSGYLTRHQLLQSLLYEVMFCERCQTLFKVNGHEHGMRIKCTVCPVMLKPPRHDLRLIASSRDLFIDSRGIEERSLYGQLAVRHRFTSEAQIAEATDRWARGLGDQTLGEILIELGHLNAHQHEELLRHVERAEADQREERKRQMGGGKFGEIAVKLGLIHPPMLLAALKRQNAAPPTTRLPIGATLVAAGHLTINQGLRILELQDKAILACGQCRKQYTASIKERGMFPACPDCKVRLGRAAMVTSLAVTASLVPPK